MHSAAVARFRGHSPNRQSSSRVIIAISNSKCRPLPVVSGMMSKITETSSPVTTMECMPVITGTEVIE